MPLLLAHLILSWVLTAPPDPLRDLGTWQPSWPSLRSPIGAVTTHSALFVFPRTTQDLENKQWGQCHRYIMMSLNLASHSKDRGQTQRDARKGFISLKKKQNLTNKKRAKLERSSIIYHLKPPFPQLCPWIKNHLFPLLDLRKSVLPTSFQMFYFSYF